MIFTQEQLDEIEKRLALKGIKDVQFPEANLPLEGTEIIAITQNGINKKVTINDLLEYVKNTSDKPTIPVVGLTKEQADKLYQPMGNYATEEWVEGKRYLTKHQDISNLATTKDVSDSETRIKKWTEEQSYLKESEFEQFKNTIKDIINNKTEEDMATALTNEDLLQLPEGKYFAPVDNKCTNKLSGVTSFGLIVIKTGTTDKYLLLICGADTSIASNGELYCRKLYNGSWSEWEKVINSSGSGGITIDSITNQDIDNIFNS